MTKQRVLISSLIVSAVIAAIGCGDGKRASGGGNNKRMFRNAAFPGTGTPTGVNQKVAGKGQFNTVNNAGGNGAALPNAKSGDEKEIQARVEQLTQGANAFEKLPAGTFQLKSRVSHFQTTDLNQGFAMALNETQYSEAGGQVIKSLTSGTFDQIDDGRTIVFADAIEVDAKGLASVPAKARFGVQSKIEPKAGKPALIEVESAVLETVPASISIVNLLTAPQHTMKDSEGKVITLKSATQTDGSLLLWISVEETAIAGKRATSFYRNFFLVYEKVPADAAVAQ